MRDVHVVAIAARTPVGLNAESSAAAIRAAISRITHHPFLVDADGEPVGCGRDGRIDTMLIGAPRFVALARAALSEMAAKLGAGGRYDGQVPVLLALPEIRPGFDEDDARWILQALTDPQVPGFGAFAVRRLGEGHAGSFRGVEEGVRRIQQGREELCVVGGVDSYLDGVTLDWLEEERRLACTQGRGGFPPGEGAALVALASDHVRRGLHLPSLAVIQGIACTLETRDEFSAESLRGEALTKAFETVAAQLARQERFDDSYCDINGDRGRTHDLAFALMRTGHLFRDSSAYITPVSSMGDQGAATLAVNCALATRAWARNYASGPNALVFGSSWAGTRGALFLQRPRA